MVKFKAADIGHEIKQLLGTKNRNMDKKTAKAKVKRQERIAGVMKDLGLQTIKSMRPRHVDAYLNRINTEHKATTRSHGRDMKPGSLALHLTELRDIAKAIGKPNILDRDNAPYEANRDQAARNNPKTVNKPNYDKAMDKIATSKHGETLSIAKASGDTIGLRRREQLYTKDIVAKLPDGRFIASKNSSLDMHEISREGLVARYHAGIRTYLDKMPVNMPCAAVEGAKTGQRRLVPLDTPEKLAAMELRMSYIRENGLKSMMPAGLKATQAENAFRNALHRAGFTKENGCNNHAARHRYAQQEVASGVSRWEVSLSMGHHRQSIIDAYVPK